MAGRDAFLRRYTGDERIFASHVLDVAADAYDRRQSQTYFCDMRQRVIAQEAAGFAGVQVHFFGGYPDFERCVAVYCAGGAEPEPPDIAAVEIRSREPLTHRDILGAVLSLGLKRERIGDIIRVEDGHIVFVLPPADRLLLDELSRVGRQAVRSSPAGRPDEIDAIREYKTIAGSVASLRLDCVIALCCGVGRSAAVEIIRSGKVFVDAVNVTSPSCMLKDGCRISVRGSGKYLFTFNGRMTGKGRYQVIVNKFI